MYKSYLIVLLALCLVSTQAFVKRDAGDDYVASVQNQIDQLAKTFADKVKETFDNEALMKHFDKFSQAMGRAVYSHFKPQE